MDDRGRRPLRRKPVPADTRFDDFDLQLLSLNEADSAETYSTPPTATHKPNVEAHSHAIRSEDVSLSRSRSWKPFYLRRAVLLGFVVLFVSLIITLAALYGYSQNHQGLSTADEKDYYLWTYGPTAVLAVIAAFWGQVVYRTKQLMPWRAMATKPQPAAKSLLLDYVSPISIVTFFKSLASSHHSVSLAVVSSFIFAALTVFSTGLFTLQYTDVTQNNATLLLANKFDLSNVENIVVDSRPASVVYAAQALGLDYPSGTTEQYAVQDFSYTQDSNVTLAGVVDTFAASLTCDVADLLVTNVTAYFPFGSLQHSGGTFSVNVTSTSCTVANLTINSGTGIDSLVNITYDTTWGFGRLVDCIARGTEAQEHRILVSVGTYRTHELWNGTTYPAGLALPYDQMFQVVNSTNLLCTPQYAIQKSRVVKRSTLTSQATFESITSASHTETQGSEAVDLARGVFASVNDPSAHGLYSAYTIFPSLPDTFFTLLGSARPFTDYYAANTFWFQHENLENLSSSLYGSIAAQVASQKLLVPINEQIVGVVTTNEPRLYVRVLSFALMEASLAVLTIITLYLLLSASDSVVPNDPGSIAGLSAIFSRSPELVHLVKDKGASTIPALQEALQGYLYDTSSSANSSARFGIRASTTSANKPITPLNTSSETIRWWQLLVLSTMSQVLVILTPLIYIAVLEILFATDRSNDGLLTIGNNSWLHYGWTYVPALLMLCVHIMYSSVNFGIRMLSPYSALHNGSVPASISVQDHPLSRISLHELFVSIRRRQLAVFAATLAVLLAPVLTIAVSGLYTAKNYTQHAGVRQLTAWNFNQAIVSNQTLLANVFSHMNESNPTNVSTQSSSTSMVTDLIITANLSYPKWTFGELALPVVEIENLPTGSGQLSAFDAGSFDVKVPAARGALNCTVIPHDEVSVTYAMYNASSMSLASWGQSGNRQCLNYSTQYSLDQGSTSCRVALFNTIDNQTLGGCATTPELLFLPSNVSGPQSFGFFSPVNFQNYTYCPFYSGMIGTTTSEEIEDYTWFFCATKVESVMTQTTFTLPDYAISVADADESTARDMAGNASTWLRNTTETYYSDPFSGPNSALSAGGIQLVDANSALTFYNVSDGQNFDNFFSALVYGRDGVPVSEMVGEANIPRLLSAVQHLWRIVYAQIFRTSMVFTSADPGDIKAWAPQQPWNATFMDPNTYRLKQSSVSTRILQGVLAALSLCAIVTFLFMDTRKVLPNNPSSIAVVGSLLAGSEMLNIVTSSQDEKHGETQYKSNRWVGYFFSLGWWERPSGARRYGIDIGKAEKAS